MTNKQALKEAVKRWGNNGAISDRGKDCASTPEKREAARVAHAEHQKAKPEVLDLANPAHFPDEIELGLARAKLRANRIAFQGWKAKRDELWSEVFAIRYHVGVATYAFEIKGSGDSWEEAFADADRKAAR